MLTELPYRFVRVLCAILIELRDLFFTSFRNIWIWISESNWNIRPMACRFYMSALRAYMWARDALFALCARASSSVCVWQVHVLFSFLAECTYRRYLQAAGALRWATNPFPLYACCFLVFVRADRRVLIQSYFFAQSQSEPMLSFMYQQIDIIRVYLK